MLRNTETIIYFILFSHQFYDRSNYMLKNTEAIIWFLILLFEPSSDLHHNMSKNTEAIIFSYRGYTLKNT